jgi:hypothetical protein
MRRLMREWIYSVAGNRAGPAGCVGVSPGVIDQTHAGDQRRPDHTPMQLSSI